MTDITRIYEAQKARRWALARTTSQDRIAKLKKFRTVLHGLKTEICAAIHQDFRKHPTESDITEFYPTISEITHTISHLADWMEPKPVPTPFVLFSSESEMHYEPKGMVLLLSPWNYPINLTLTPLIAAISAVNTVIIKPSSKVPATSAILKKIVAAAFPEDEVAVIEGNPAVADALLELPFDHVFFTGSPKIGKKVMTAAARHLASVTLELGGKSPVIVDKSANLKHAAERIGWGKFINGGQTCVAPDYLLIHRSVQDEFVAELGKVITKRYGGTPEARKNSENFCRLVSRAHASSLKQVLAESIAAGARVAYGGATSDEERYIEPTILTNVTSQSPIMREEIFGPILPVLPYDRVEDVLKLVQSGEKPLALYVFSKDEDFIQTVLKGTTAGGTCINSLIVHLGNPDLPFGGVGMSGQGSYHGFHGFRQLSHERAVYRQGPIDTLKLFYPPYTETVKKLV
ncbi:MAG: aldehyde dehydrogenase family protein, partial [Bdellovibrionota bacterium]